jgi:hypothetical protein
MFHGFTPFFYDVPLPSSEFSTDACLEGGAGHNGNDWFYVKWDVDVPRSEFSTAHINQLELLTVFIAAKRWGPTWTGCHILVRSNNTATVATVNKGTSRSSALLAIIYELFWLSMTYSFKLSAAFVPGRSNVLADCLSRMNVFDHALCAHNLLVGECPMMIPCSGQMSSPTFACLQVYWRPT